MFTIERIDKGSDVGLILNRTVDGRNQVTTDGELVRASRSYRVTDPHDIARKLEARGYDKIEVIAPRIFHSKKDEGITRQGRRYLLHARYPGQTGTEYHDFVKFILDHSGRECFKVSAGPVRLACTNEFYAAPICLRHNDSALDEWLERPWEAAEVVRDSGRTALNRLEFLRTTPGTALRDFLGNMKRPRLFAALDRVAGWYDESAWGILQSLTHTKKPTLVTMAQLALTDEVYPDVLAGKVPSNWIN